eukprot:jgi/Ulvmu1/10714/UM067_0041.1
MDAVQLAHDFAIYKPVLQALQEERLLTPPFGDTLFSETQPPLASPVPAPAWENDETASGWLQSRVGTMDNAQRAAFDHALTRSVAMIQGPPGTGKTYIAINVARALLAHGANKLLLVTYTNHALDQILEAILDSGLPSDKVLRIGGRSSSERIEKLSFFAQMNAQRDSGTPPPLMEPAEKARNYALKLEVSSLMAKLQEEVQQLTALPWDTPSDIPLLELEGIIEVALCIQPL